MSEESLVTLVNAMIDAWVDEEMGANGDTVSRDQRLREHRAEFLESLSVTWKKGNR